MRRKIFAFKLIILFNICIVLGICTISTSGVEAKTIKEIRNGGYITDVKSAKIKDGKLICKGKVENWERATTTKEYSKKGTFKLKLAKNCKIEDGYRETTQTISKSQFNKLCKKHDSSHTCITFMVKKNKIALLKFW